MFGYGDPSAAVIEEIGVYGMATRWSAGSPFAIGTVGQNSNTSGTGIAGFNGTNYVVLNDGSGGSFTGFTYGVAGFSFRNNGTRAGGYVALDWGVGYKINGTGSVATIMTTRAGPKNLIAPESPEAWFEDFGNGQLNNGKSGKITLDPLFLDCITVNEKHPLKVFVQLEDDCNGVYVKKYKDGFEVIELQNGTSNAKFSYRVVAKRKGAEHARFEDAPPPLRDLAKVQNISASPTKSAQTIKTIEGKEIKKFK